RHGVAEHPPAFPTRRSSDLNLSADEIEAIATLAIERIYPKGSHIFCQGEPIENVYFIVNGAIKIYWTDPKGREHIINILEAGEIDRKSTRLNSSHVKISYAV